MQGKKIVRLAVLLTRVFLGIIYLLSGLSKLVDGFPSIIGPTWLVDVLAPHELALFARFVAVSEAVVGAMLLTQRFATLGAVMLFPIQMCILVVTVSLGWQGTPYVNTFLLLLNTGLLLYDWPKLKFIFR